MFLQQTWHVVTTAHLEFFEHAHFHGVALVRIGAAEALVNVAVEVDLHAGADPVFEWFDSHVIPSTKLTRP